MCIPMSNQRVTRSTIAEKLHPLRFPEMSGGMMAFVGYVVEEQFTDPVIAEMVLKGDVVIADMKANLNLSGLHQRSI